MKGENVGQQVPSRDELVAQFERFLEKARPLVAENLVEANAEVRPRLEVTPAEPSHDSKVADFERFLDQARPLVVGNMIEAMVEVRPRLELVRPWMLDQDILTVVGASFVEDAYTELLAWVLYPQGNPTVALACQRAWLSVLGITKASSIETPVIPHTQFVAQGGRPDMIMDYRAAGFVVVVELKTGSEEHDTPHGGMQTEAYPQLVRRSLALPDECDVEMVFLTPSGIPAANEQAINTTYHQFVVALAITLDGLTLDSSLKWSYSTIFTHLLRHASPNRLDGAKILRTVSVLLEKDTARVRDGAMLANLAELRSCIMLLALEADL